MNSAKPVSTSGGGLKEKIGKAWKKTKKIGMIGLGIGLVGGYVATTLPFATYTLHKTQYSVEKIWGDIVDVESEPGIHFKDKWYIPPFIRAVAKHNTQVEYLDKRLQEYRDTPEIVMTRDDKFIYMDRFCKWRIIEPIKYMQFVKTPDEAQRILDAIVFEKVWTKVGSYTFEENLETLRAEIRKEMIKTANKDMEMFGIGVEDIRMKTGNIPEKSRKTIHERMIAEANKTSAGIRAEGEKEKRNWQGKKGQEVKRIKSEAQKEVETILGGAERRVAELYKQAYGEEDPQKLDFYKFWESMDTLKGLKENKPTLILSTDNPLLDNILNGGEIDKKHLDFEVEPIVKDKKPDISDEHSMKIIKPDPDTEYTMKYVYPDPDTECTMEYYGPIEGDDVE